MRFNSVFKGLNNSCVQEWSQLEAAQTHKQNVCQFLFCCLSFITK